MWALGAVLLLANWPFTLAVIRPVNNRLKAAAPGENVRSLVQRWGRLHAVRSVLGLAATAILAAAAAGA